MSPARSGAAASMSHTGALVGSDETFSTALSRSGVLRVESVSQLFAAAKVLSSDHYREPSERLVIITNHTQIAIFLRKQLRENVLCAVCVLVFIYKNKLKIILIIKK